MKKISDNHLKTFAKIHDAEIIREKNEDRISWESQYLRSLREVVANNSKPEKSYLNNSNIFDLENFQWTKSPLIYYLLHFLKKESE